MNPYIEKKRRRAKNAIGQAQNVHKNNIRVHPWGFIVSQALNQNKEEIAELMRRFQIKEPVTPVGVGRAMIKGGKPFMAAFDKIVLRPFANVVGDEIDDLVSFEGNVVPDWYANVTGDAASKQRDPRRGEKILTGLSAATNILDTVLGTVGAIKTINNPAPAPVQTLPAVQTASPTSAAARTAESEDDKNKNMFLYIGAGALLLIIVVLLILKNKK